MEAIIQRGFIVVGITDAPLFAELENGEREGIDVDFAKALAAALLDGDLTRVRYVVVSAQERFQKAPQQGSRRPSEGHDKHHGT